MRIGFRHGYAIIITILFLHLLLYVNTVEAETKIIKAGRLQHVDGVLNSQYGEVVTGIGDYNLDGYEDFIVGGRAWHGFRGKTWFYFGSENGVNNVDANFTIIGEPNKGNDGLCLGHSAVNLGDINQDGVIDFGIGGPGSWGNWDVGRVYLFYGNSSPFPSTVGRDEVFMIESPKKYDWFGETFMSAGDFNGDSYRDIIVGAPGSSTGEGQLSAFENGTGYIFLGSSNGFGSTPNITLNENILYTGYALALDGNGDINNDGFDDVIIGAHWDSNSQGKIYVYLGLSTLNPNPDPDLILSGDDYLSEFGRKVKIIEDINNDGYDEIAVRNSIFINEFEMELEPRVSIYYGREDITEITTPDLILSTGEEDDEFGDAISSVGDINEDGFADFAIGAPGVIGQYDTTHKGKVYIYYGGLVPDADADKIIVGEEVRDNFGFSLGVVDANGDSVPDVLMGSIGYNQTGRVYIYLSGLFNEDEGLDPLPYLIFFGSIIVVLIIGWKVLPKLRKIRSINNTQLKN